MRALILLAVCSCASSDPEPAPGRADLARLVHTHVRMLPPSGCADGPLTVRPGAIDLVSTEAVADGVRVRARVYGTTFGTCPGASAWSRWLDVTMFPSTRGWWPVLGSARFTPPFDAPVVPALEDEWRRQLGALCVALPAAASLDALAAAVAPHRGPPVGDPPLDVVDLLAHTIPDERPRLLRDAASRVGGVDAACGEVFGRVEGL